MLGVSHTIKLTPSDETLEDRGGFTIINAFIGINVEEEGMMERNIGSEARIRPGGRRIPTSNHMSRLGTVKISAS
jgi:hypothetical protein